VVPASWGEAAHQNAQDGQDNQDDLTLFMVKFKVSVPQVDGCAYLRNLRKSIDNEEIPCRST
jgi:hypothetical protein